MVLPGQWGGYYGGSFASLFRFHLPMNRVPVFVDAGYVFAQGSVLLAGWTLPRRLRSNKRAQAERPWWS